MTYSEKLKDPRWQKRRLQILQRDNWSCTKCGDNKNTLHVHHKEYQNEPWDADDVMLETLCEGCHLYIESSKKFEFNIVADYALTAGSNNETKLYVTLFDDDRVYFIKVAGGHMETMLIINKEMFFDISKHLKGVLQNG